MRSFEEADLGGLPDHFLYFTILLAESKRIRGECGYFQL
jgi:hypothetical protein